MTNKSKQKPKLVTSWKQMLTLLLAFIIPFSVITILFNIFLSDYVVPSASMETTLMTGDQVFAYNLQSTWTPERGKIVVFTDSLGWLKNEPKYSNPQFLVKRVVGLPGDTIMCCDAQGALVINGYSYPETYTQGVNPTFPLQTVPEGHIFVLGDNREVSADSAYHIQDGTQFIDIKNVKSIPFLRYWPLNTWSGLN